MSRHDSRNVTENSTGGKDFSCEGRQFSGGNNKGLVNKADYAGFDTRWTSTSDMNVAMNRVPNYPKPFDGLRRLPNRFFIICDKSSLYKSFFILQDKIRPALRLFSINQPSSTNKAILTPWNLKYFSISLRHLMKTWGAEANPKGSTVKAKNLKEGSSDHFPAKPMCQYGDNRF